MKWILSSALLATTLTLFQVFFFNQPVKSSKEVIEKMEQFFSAVQSLPKYAEAGYSPLGRSPIVDLLLGDPLYAPVYAKDLSAVIKNSTAQNNLYDLSSALFASAGIPSLQTETDQFPMTVPAQFQENFSSLMAQRLYGHWVAFKKIHQQVKTLLAVLNEEEKLWIQQNYDRFVFGEKVSEYDFFTTDSPYPLKFFELASKIDLGRLADAGRQLALIADELYREQDELKSLQLDEDFVWEEGNLKLCISTKSHTTHKESADFFLDLGGYNTIETNAGGTGGTYSVSFHFDLRGHNTYIGQKFVQGAGFLGVGMLFSCEGNNSYQAEAYSQGCGYFGVGFLINLKGNNRFTINFGGQSCALFGSSILWNKEGHNEYVARQGMAQAASSTLGVAYLIDNQGNNSYLSGEPGKHGTTRYGGIGQGGSAGVRADPWLSNPSFYGGLSFLYIGEGHNKLKTVWLGQGSAYFLGAGIISAEGSNDLFEADYDSQGQGLHLAVGIALKKGDNGQFKGGWGSLGVGGDRSVGMFIGFGKNNLYQGTDQSVGTSRKPKSLGLFINIGGNNTYKFAKLSNARLQFPQSPKEWSTALFLEVGHPSSYPERVDEFVRGSDLEWGIQQHSLGISTQHLSDDPEETLFAQFHEQPQVPFSYNLDSQVNSAYRPLEQDANEAQELADEIIVANYERRRQIYESLDLMRFKDRHIDYDLSYLLKVPAKLDEDVFNFAVMWALRNKNKVDLSPIKDALKNDKFQSDYTKRMAVELVGTFWTPDSDALLQNIMLKKASEETRYFAALVLAIHLSDNTIEALRKGINSDSELVRYAIAKGLQENSHPASLALLRSLFEDKSFYVRRAAGLSAISLKDTNGIPVVLETLQYETLDTGDNYGDNIYRQLSNYLNVDFGLDREAWIKWWEQSKHDYKL